MSTNTTVSTPTKTARPMRFARQPVNTGAAPSEPAAPQPAGADAPSPAPARTSKIDEVIALLGREGGATLAEITSATGWLPHSARAALTGLRKKGHAVEKAKRGDVTCYRIAAGAR